ncbi:hypothetical protein Lal_00006570 [Lupinus albus]|uniref:Uncharacterized protein n=1 Tax=Lupinus albus TaxID=3870 RepID=A0A6A5MSU2_LUPAL|nr:hypothetical protein Lalb_Chr07g0185901 [Lupinus albus]KAF1875939.1 hypothetical protein Lal_00006570 [Lupinus albus]
MVLNSLVVFSVARFSTQAWQWLLCIRDPFSVEEIFDILFTFPFQQLHRLALGLWDFFCLQHPYDFMFSYLPSDEDDVYSVNTFDYDDGFYYHSHSD